MRHLVTVQDVKEIQPIEGADAIEKARIKDWWVVVKKREFQPGDLCLFYEIDSFLPLRPEYEFLLRGNSPRKMFVNGIEKEGIRLKTVKLRGQISQGLILPLPKNLPKKIGFDCSEILGVVKYEPPIPAHLRGVVKGPLPSFIPKTDEERIQNCADVLGKHRGKVFYVTSKLDGCSATFYKFRGGLGVCCRNLELKETAENTFWKIARQYEIEQKIPEGFAIQGEIIGESIQGNPLKIKGHKLYVFNTYDIEKTKYLDFDDFKKFVEKIMDLETVPVIDDNLVLNHTIEDLLQLANAKSPLNPNVIQEGIVVRPVKEATALIAGAISRFSFKVVSVDYLLKYEQ